MNGTRMNVQFSEQQKKTLEGMAAELGTSQAGVLKTALSLLSAAIREREQKHELAFVKDDKVVKHVIGIFNQ